MGNKTKRYALIQHKIALLAIADSIFCLALSANVNSKEEIWTIGELDDITGVTADNISNIAEGVAYVTSDERLIRNYIKD